MSYDKDELSNMSGENVGSGSPKLLVNSVRIQGNEGAFKKTLLTQARNEQDRFDVEELGEEINVIFLKIRRYLSHTDGDGKLIAQTSEHSTPNDPVTLYQTDKSNVTGIASSLREEYPDLRTIQVIYAFLLKGTEMELIKLIIKGSSLGSDNKPENSIPFYDYLTSFNRTKENREHTFEYVTKIVPKEEKGKAGNTYYAMSFERSAKITDAVMEEVANGIKKVHTHTEEYDTYMRTKIQASGGSLGTQQEAEGSQINTKVDENQGIDELPTIQIGSTPEQLEAKRTENYPKEDINPDNIPF